MLVATFGPSTAWLGKKITFKRGAFSLEGHGKIDGGRRGLVRPPRRPSLA